MVVDSEDLSALTAQDFHVTTGKDPLRELIVAIDREIEDAIDLERGK